VSDADLRALERATVASPADAAAHERLERARLRAGLGWAGERLPAGICPPGALDLEQGVYALFAPPLQLVHVPGGEVSCEACRDGGPFGRLCGVCQATGRVALAPFYVGRFPVTWDEFRAFCDATEGERLPVVPSFLNELRHEHGRHPVVNVVHDEALAFCAWAGLRLPTAVELRWAALGQPAGAALGGVVLGGGEVPPRRYPWGNEEPTPERCAAADDRYRPDSPDSFRIVRSLGSTAPVTEWLPPRGTFECRVRARHLIPIGGSEEVTLLGWYRSGEGFFHAVDDLGGRLTIPPRDLEPLPTTPRFPARPAGRSWCGAHDVVGNAWQLTEDGQAWGGSFKTMPPGQLLNPDVDPSNDVGFRVALSCAQ
jgi:formylglycine-generating enzyme required for sulfatase activity